MEEPREARDARDATGEQFAACARYAGLPSVADPLPPAYPILANCGSLPSGLASVDRDHATDRASARHPRQTPRNRRQPHGDRPEPNRSHHVLEAVRASATEAGVVPGAMIEVVTGGGHRGGAAVAVNRTGSQRPQGVGHVRLGESTPFHRT